MYFSIWTALWAPPLEGDLGKHLVEPSSGSFGCCITGSLGFFLFLFFNLIYFNWRLITLQYCGFCHTSTWISRGRTCVPSSWIPLPPSSPPHPSGLSQSTNFECPASCIELALVICFTYGNIHVSVLFSQVFPSRLLPRSPKVCSLHLCLFCCLAYGVIITVFLNFIYIFWYTILVFLFLTYFTLYNRLQLQPPCIESTIDYINVLNPPCIEV